MFKKIKSKTLDFETHRAALSEHQVDLSKTKSIWLAHNHYDHMMVYPFSRKRYKMNAFFVSYFIVSVWHLSNVADE